MAMLKTANRLSCARNLRKAVPDAAQMLIEGMLTPANSTASASRRFVATFGIGPGDWRKTGQSAVKSPARPQPFPIL